MSFTTKATNVRKDQVKLMFSLISQEHELMLAFRLAKAKHFVIGDDPQRRKQNVDLQECKNVNVGLVS